MHLLNLTPLYTPEASDSSWHVMFNLVFFLLSSTWSNTWQLSALRSDDTWKNNSFRLRSNPEADIIISVPNEAESKLMVAFQSQSKWVPGLGLKPRQCDSRAPALNPPAVCRPTTPESYEKVAITSSSTQPPTSLQVPHLLFAICILSNPWAR